MNEARVDKISSMQALFFFWYGFVWSSAIATLVIFCEIHLYICAILSENFLLSRKWISMIWLSLHHAKSHGNMRCDEGTYFDLRRHELGERKDWESIWLWTRITSPILVMHKCRMDMIDLMWWFVLFIHNIASSSWWDGQSRHGNFSKSNTNEFLSQYTISLTYYQKSRDLYFSIFFAL